MYNKKKETGHFFTINYIKSQNGPKRRRISFSNNGVNTKLFQPHPHPYPHAPSHTHTHSILSA